MGGSLSNILNLGVKEFRSLWRDRAMLLLIAWAFTMNVYSAATGLPDSLHNAPIAVFDEDRSPLATRLLESFQPPYFLPAQRVTPDEMARGMDSGRYTFGLSIPPNFQEDVLAGRRPTLLISVDATQISQAFIGAGYIQNIIADEVLTFAARSNAGFVLPSNLAIRVEYNPNLIQKWFGAVMEVLNEITMLSVILTGAALIREREHGTLEHLLVMPVTPLEIMCAKVWSMVVVVLLAAALSLICVVQGLLAVPINGSMTLFLGGAALALFASSSLGILLGTIARSMPQLGLLTILMLLPLLILSGSITPSESMPQLVQDVMQLMPTTHFVSMAQAVLYRGAGLSLVWPQFLAMAGIGLACFMIALTRLRHSVAAN
ncbi:ABC transporter permease [Ectopseudomonas hydrolytica]|uniref:ABC transporter permease n=1 Tax=Ectopseudomonas hydrolytica TaxID=2493633 RepID=UPI003EDF339D